jgi:DNA uptake protein ComE-like DNA-binding protein
MHGTPRTILSGALVLALVAFASPAFATSKTAAHPAGPVDVNNASMAQLESLPGVGPSTAQKIVAGRPYTSMDDLKAKTHMPEATAAKLNGMVTFGAPGSASAPAAPPAAAPAASPAHGSHASSGKSHAAAPTGPIDINTASAAELESIHGVGPATANKIIAGRPYSSTADLAKLHLPKNTMDQIMPSVAASAVAAAPAAHSAPTAAPAAPPAHAHTAPHSDKPAAEAQVPPVQGMVWVNLESKVYHYQGDQWYGRTKNGKFMTEQEAIAAGCRPAKKGGHHEGDKDHEHDHDQEHDGDHDHGGGHGRG